MKPMRGMSRIEASSTVLPSNWVKAFELRVPALVHDGGVDAVAFLPPSLDVGRPAALLGQPDSPVERHPAHEPPVHERLASTAGLPDPFLGLVPVVDHPVDHP